MQTFKINRNSWHYKMNRTFWNENEHHMEPWEHKHSSFCSYWRATVFRMVGLAFVSSFLIGMGVMLSIATIMNPATAGYTVLGIVSFFAVVIGIAMGHEYLQEYKEKNPEPKTLIGKQYAAYKSKICPSVEFEQ